MKTIPGSGLIRTFLPAKDFVVEKQFYHDLGFTLGYDAADLCVFYSGNYSFYLQDYYVKDWADNFMMFMEVKDLDSAYHHMLALNLKVKYPTIRITKPEKEHWGRVFRIITPTGVLWYFGEFIKDS